MLHPYMLQIQFIVSEACGPDSHHRVNPYRHLTKRIDELLGQIML